MHPDIRLPQMALEGERVFLAGGRKSRFLQQDRQGSMGWAGVVYLGYLELAASRLLL
jgi:hypothetical protein